MERPNFFELKNGSKVKLPFTDKEYKNRSNKLREEMSKNNLDMIILTSMHNIAYYTGFIYCSFGRSYGCVITNKKVVTVSANIDAGQPWRRSAYDNIIYTDWKRDNFLKSIVSIIGRDEPPKNIGIEHDHITLEVENKLKSIFSFSNFSDISKKLMKLRMIKSKEEIDIIKKVFCKQFIKWTAFVRNNIITYDQCFCIEIPLYLFNDSAEGWRKKRHPVFKNNKVRVYFNDSIRCSLPC